MSNSWFEDISWVFGKIFYSIFRKILKIKKLKLRLIFKNISKVHQKLL